MEGFRGVSVGDCAGCEGRSPVRVARDHSVEEEEGRS